MSGDAELTLVLYGRRQCHLCDLAERELAVLRQAGAAEWQLRCVDVDTSPELAARYGLRVPVLRCPDGSELDWPFRAAQIRRALGAGAAGGSAS
ncbi:MAG: glutaredoxin family protein [Gammaproteobacteria bacterium AqS3]|nr:glutaredoxin family protein [Gammaproteobacteria bacterium AqS3]